VQWNLFKSRRHLASVRRHQRPRAARPAFEELESRLVPSVSVLTYHNDNASTGQNLSETALTTTNVNAATFGKLFTASVDGQVYAQPLVQAGVDITTGPNQGVHNVVFVATEHDSLYAIDADNGQQLWKDSFLTGPAGTTVSTVPARDLQTDPLAIDPEIGITGTPVIDPASNTLYVVALTKEAIAGDSVPHYVQRLHAVSLSDGRESFFGPVVIADTSYNGPNYTFDNGSHYIFNSGPFVYGTGDGSEDGEFDNTIDFNVARQLQRSALTLAGGRVYIDYASYSDATPYHGWVLGYDASTLQLKAVFNDTPNGTAGGIWESGAGLAVDPAGALYFESGNGTFDTTLGCNGMPSSADYGDSFVKLVVDCHSDANNQNANGWGLKVADYFTPYNQADLQQQDLDLGSAGPLVLPDSVGSTDHPHLLVGSSKEGTIYLIDRDNMGHFNPDGDNVVQSLLAVIGPAYDTPAYFNNGLYYAGVGDHAQVFTIADSSAQISTLSASQSTDTFGFPGSTPSISANGTSNGIAWDLDRVSNELRAYDATNYANELYTSDQASDQRDALGRAIKFTVPTVANGHLYVGTADSLVIYGLFALAPPAAPSVVTANVAGRSEVDLNWVSNSSNQTGFRIERATDSDFTHNLTVVANTAADATSYADIGVHHLRRAFYYRVIATNANGDSADSNTASTVPSLIPEAPSGLTVSLSGNQVTLNWVNNSSDQSGVKVERATDGAFTQDLTLLATTGATDTTYSDTPDAPATYYYRVRANNAFGDSDNSNTAGITLVATGWAATDVGYTSFTGSTTFDGTTWTVHSGGTDIWDTSDHFQYAYHTVTGDVTLVAHITSVDNTSDWAKAGIMFRDGLAADAPYVAVLQNPGNQLEFQWRLSPGADTGWTDQLADTTDVKWVQLIRNGDDFSAYYAETTDPPTSFDWVLIGTQTLAMSAPTMGLALSVGDDNEFGTATFTDVSVSDAPPAPPSGLTAATGFYYRMRATNAGGDSANSNTVAVTTLPAGWLAADAGKPGQTGSTSFDGITWTVNGGGSDIWDSLDQTGCRPARREKPQVSFFTLYYFGGI
jgi:hypothetical protein